MIDLQKYTNIRATGEGRETNGQGRHGGGGVVQIVGALEAPIEVYSEQDKEPLKGFKKRSSIR